MELWAAPVSSLPRGGPARTWQVDGQRGTGTGSPPPLLPLTLLHATLLPLSRGLRA